VPDDVFCFLVQARRRRLTSSRGGVYTPHTLSDAPARRPDASTRPPALVERHSASPRAKQLANLAEHGAEGNFGGGSRNSRVLTCALEDPCSINQEPACAVCSERDAGQGPRVWHHGHAPREKEFTTESQRQLHHLKGALVYAEFTDSDQSPSLPKAMVLRSPRLPRWPDLRLRLRQDRDRNSRKTSERISEDLKGTH